MPLDCKDFVVRLGTPEATGDAELQGHLAQCPDCRAAAAVVQLLERTRGEPEQMQLAGFAARLNARRRSGRRTPLLAGALASGAIAAAAVFAMNAARPTAEPTLGDAPHVASVEAARPEARVQPFEGDSGAADFDAAYLVDDLAWDDESADDGPLDGELAKLDRLLDFGDEADGAI